MARIAPERIPRLSTPPIQLSEYLAAAREAALLAWESIRPFFRGSYSVYEKAGEGPATEADIAADRRIGDFLRGRFPGQPIGFLTEESHKTEERLAMPLCWIIDPIDGTRSFIDGNDGWVIQIGLASSTQALAGVVYQPTTGMMYLGGQGLGAWVENIDDGWRRELVVSPQSSLRDARIALTNSRIDRLTREALDRLSPASVGRMGSAGLKIMEVASGRADLYFSAVPRRCKEWDVCGPAAILLAAGGRVSDLGGEELAYNQVDYSLGRGFLASNGPLHDIALNRLCHRQGAAQQ